MPTLLLWVSVLLPDKPIQIPQGQTTIIQLSVEKCAAQINIFGRQYKCDSQNRIIVGIDPDFPVGIKTTEIGLIEVVPTKFTEERQPYRRKRGKPVFPEQRQQEKDEINTALSAGEKYPDLKVATAFCAALCSPDGYITGPFWANRITYRKRKGKPEEIVRSYNHRGVDLRTGHVTGKPVHAIGGGVIVLATEWEFSSEGYMLILYHGNGVYSLYMHLRKNSYRVKEGQMVETGQVIALSGDSGNADGSPHLHLQTKVNGALVDPLQLIELFKSAGAAR